ncbi:hypothetical protein T459_19853 [Capsicum annuum]|uniref:ERAD-associated E3 ubiquitin-protein ligase component HRD3A n=1 Tax=Capsicum annuum TaxID=4072 RepID=A0A2G2Z355_CAPAN|nr:hypothetical protein T459_19853 [Capsicum annuum]
MKTHKIQDQNSKEAASRERKVVKDGGNNKAWDFYPTSNHFVSTAIDLIIATNRRHGMQSKEYFEQAADNEEAGGLYNLGVMYLKGIGVNRDTKIASKYFINAFDAGQPKTFYQMAKMFHTSCVAASVALRHANTVWTCSAAVDNVPPRHAIQSYAWAFEVNPYLRQEVNYQEEVSVQES